MVLVADCLPASLSACRLLQLPYHRDATTLAEVSDDELSDDVESEYDENDAAEDDEFEDDIEDDYDDGNVSENTSERSGTVIGRRLWDAARVYPKGVRNWRDVSNCAAALQYDCGCGKMCLAKVCGVIELYEHRRTFRARAKKLGSGGLRDVMREELERHFDAASRSFSTSFVIGGVGTLCERAFAVGSGVSEPTFVRARADVTKSRPLHAGRVQLLEKRVQAARAALDAWVRAQRNTMEGDKTTGLKWYTEKTTARQLWQRYLASCDRAQQPAQGSQRLLALIWKEHTEIVEVKPTGHAICSTCSDIHAQRIALEGLDDTDAHALRAQLDEEAEAHLRFHSTERHYYDNAVHMATHHPERVTCITIDAPTQHQFDLPCQARWKRDTSKKLDGTRRWQSKVEGVLDAGVGMLVFCARVALGGGANMVATVLLLTLMLHVELGRTLGVKLHLQVDNTVAENKNKTIIGVAALLVAWKVFHEVTIFYLPVGHTYNELDAAFSPLITALLRQVIATVTGMIAAISEALAGKRVRVVRYIHHLWDFDAWMREHMHDIGGFARTQQSSGMHEFHLFRDSEGHVRLTARQSSQSTTWLPEGDGELVFKSVPSASAAPPIASVRYAGSAWKRDEVQTNVRRWLPHLGLHTDELNAAIKEWENTFAAAVEDSSTLPSELCLRWTPLLEATPLQMTANFYPAVHAGRDMVENPAVNPIYGESRSALQASRELREHQADQCRLALELGVYSQYF